ncbi:DUF2313 domain-containing protein [Bacillaceae bacterium Marseille-Q3522]|nr:DUF2313 domain-containing protein [Bacillaceae bacterium Marseille-Q3522]
MRIEVNELKEYVPSYYEDVLEMNTLVKVEDTLFQGLKEHMQHIQDNQFILTCDLTTLARHEQMLGILADPMNETEEFRRLRIINRLNTRPPFTLDFLIRKLNEIYGRGNFNVYVDYPSYTLYIESSSRTAEWYKETNITVNAIKPANIRYVHIPIFFEQTIMNERAFFARMEFAKVGYAQVGITQLEKRGPNEEVPLN